MKTKIFLSVLTLGTVLISCDSFLKEDSGDLMIPTQISEFQPLIYGEGYPRTYDRTAGWINLATDDVELGLLTPQTNTTNTNSGYDFGETGVREGRLPYTWQFDMSALNEKFWEDRYTNILGCNTIIDALPGIVYSENETGKYNYLAAQAYMLRAYHYFCLINTYAEPYSQANLNKPGVVLRTDPGVKESTLKMSRATVGEIYGQITKDLEMAEKYMAISDYSLKIHLLNPQALLLFKTRVALFMEDWDTVIETGTEFLKENSYIFDLNTIPIAQMGQPSASATSYFYMFNPNNKEVVFSFGSTTQSYVHISINSLFTIGFRTSYSKKSSLVHAYKGQYLSNTMGVYDPITDPADYKVVYDDSDDMEEVFGESEPDTDIVDLRLRAYYRRNIVSGSRTTYYYYQPIKFRSMNLGVNEYTHENWRTVEVVLNLAEAYARNSAGISSDAIALLNTLRKHRIRTEKYVEYSTSHFASKEELVKFIWQERRRELSFEENIRFWDIRRQGGKQLYHKWLDTDKIASYYKLPADSPNWVMPIPVSETATNDLIIQNNREDVNPL